MNMIEITQRKALRILFIKEWFSSKKELYSINILPVSTLCNVNLCLHVFKISSNMVKNNIQIRQVNDVHRYRTRTRENFVTLTLTLPPMVKHKFSLNIFKTRIKEHFYESYCEINKM
ncbi:hypothetical protein ACKWTF_012267 [Chironomus riparius]